MPIIASNPLSLRAKRSKLATRRRSPARRGSFASLATTELSLCQWVADKHRSRPITSTHDQPNRERNDPQNVTNSQRDADPLPVPNRQKPHANKRRSRDQQHYLRGSH